MLDCRERGRHSSSCCIFTSEFIFIKDVRTVSFLFSVLSSLLVPYLFFFSAGISFVRSFDFPLLILQFVSYFLRSCLLSFQFFIQTKTTLSFHFCYPLFKLLTQNSHLHITINISLFCLPLPHHNTLKTTQSHNSNLLTTTQLLPGAAMAIMEDLCRH